jgi:uncharacterized membrane protein
MEKKQAEMNGWTWAYLAVTGAVFGFWQKSIAAGIFMFLFVLLLTQLLYIVTRAIDRVQDLLYVRLEDRTGGCTGFSDCTCWWHTEQRAIAEKK